MKNLIMIAALLTAVSAAWGQTMPCAAPPFISNTVQPNLLIAMDNSGSMGDMAYWDKIQNISGTDYDTLWYKSNNPPRYYGYFNPDSLYNFSGSSFKSSPTGTWPGWLLNWATMSRIDVLRKVLVGGKYSGNTLTAQCRSTYYKRYYKGNTDNYNQFTITVSGGKTYVQITTAGSNPPINATLGNSVVAVDAPTPFRGIIHQIADKDENGQWDDNAPRFGLWLYNNGQGDRTLEGGGQMANNGGHISSYINEPTLTDLVQAIQNVNPENWTPLAENHFEILHYFAQVNPYYSNTNYTKQIGGVKDPYYNKDLRVMIPCAKSFVLLLTDGEPTQDRIIPDNDASLPNCTGLRNYYNGEHQPPVDEGSNGRSWLDDVVLYGYTNDLRPDNVGAPNYLPGTQNVALYTVFCFGRGSELLKSAAKCGSFIDKNGNKRPDLQSEWDEDGDGVPDGYFEAENGYELEDQIMRAILSIMARASAASAVSIVSGSSAGEGTVHQAYFQPALYQGADMVEWMGFMRALWIDRYGNLREDTNLDGMLQMKDGTGVQGDYVVQMNFDPGLNETRARRYRDTDGMGGTVPSHPLEYVDEVALGDIRDVWNAGKWLYNNPHTSRNIKTFVDSDNDGIVDAGELKDFTTANAAVLRPYLAAATNAQAESLILYIRGVDYPNLRQRTLSGQVWKLGDIIHSTPAYAGRPTERFDQVYGDATYAEFYQQYKNRRNLVIVGANDGMIHAFNAGRYIPNSDPTSNTKGWLDNLGQPLGKEMWAYVPKNLLPHLQWLPKLNYCHVYYQDLKIKITDVRIFAPDAVHPEGWGTIMIAGMRLGGFPYTMGANTYRSAYTCIDITNPDNPTPLWEINMPDMGFTVSYPAVARVGEQDIDWFAVVGGGPTALDGTSNRKPKIYVIRLKTGQIAAQFDSVMQSNTSIGDPIAVDWDLNYKADAFYFGTYGQWGAALGRMCRLVTCNNGIIGNESPNPADWKMNILLDVQRPITAGPVASNDEFGKRWVFFGTGRYFSESDEADASSQYLIGIKDLKLDSTFYMGQLRNVTNIAVKGIDSVSYNGTSGPWIKWNAFMNDMAAYNGWYRVLPVSGNLAERCVSKPAVIGGAFLATSFVPSNDPCAQGGEGFLYALYYQTGTAFYNPIIALNASGAHGVGTGDNPIKISLGEGQPSAPSIHIGAHGEQTFIQTPTGAVISVGTTLPFNPRSGNLFWKQQ